MNTETSVAEATKPETVKLYKASSIIPRFAYRDNPNTYKDVHITWCVVDRNEPVVPYAKAIKGYGLKDENEQLYARVYLDELLTELEYKLLDVYLREAHGDDTLNKWAELETPINADNVLPVTGQAFGGGVDCIPIYEESGYCPGFKVVGCFDIRGNEVIG